MLELYQSEGCPHSQQVRERLSELGVSYVVHNPRLPGDDGGEVTNAWTSRELTELGGRDEIPCLIDTSRGTVRYGDETIVDYVERYYA